MHAKKRRREERMPVDNPAHCIRSRWTLYRVARDRLADAFRRFPLSPPTLCLCVSRLRVKNFTLQSCGELRCCASGERLHRGWKMKKLAVLLISGWAHGAEAMYPLADVMRDSHPVSSFSLAELLMQGKGEDSQNGAISAYARAISRHLDESGEPACIVGWSTGGIVAIEAAANNPRKSRSPGASEYDSAVLLGKRIYFGR